MHRPSRALPFIAGVGCLAVLACTATFWKPIVARYHLHRLRGKAGYLEEILDRPEGTWARAAVREYLKSEEGKDALLRVVFGWHKWHACFSMPIPQTEGVTLLLTPEVPRPERVRPSLIQAIPELLPETEESEQPWTWALLPDFPGFGFRLVKGFRVPGDKASYAYFCAIRRIPAPGNDPATP